MIQTFVLSMKKLLGIGLLIGWSILTVTSNSSCESTTSNTSPDTIKLSSTVILSPGIADTDGLRLTCGCAFVLDLQTSGGDTSVFQVTDIDTLAKVKTPHRLVVTLKPGTPSGVYNAWYAFSAVDHLGGTDRDTLLLAANF